MERWARWCHCGDSTTVMSLCGLTWAGSPHTIMGRIWECGAVDQSEVTGYSDAPREGDPEPQQTDQFMARAKDLTPGPYYALVARHLRIVNGEPVLMRSERWMAQALYGLSARASWDRLATDCVAGYAALRLWEAQRKAA
ncbi:MAG: hypothetical protein KGL39_40095 [Patescibacteria group bacterium]|nr:hypothetical protein [Patescibacteria group bacterium]